MAIDNTKVTAIKNALDERFVKTSESENFTSAEKTKLAGLKNTSITVEQQTTAESGFATTYVIKQDNEQVGVKINIPKDFLVRSGEVKTCTADGDPVVGLKKDDKYLDFIVNTADDSVYDSHIYIPVADLVDVYTGDESTITVADNVFSVKNGGITLEKLSASVQTSLGYADEWNTSVAKNITSANVTSWNNKSDLTTSDVEGVVGDYLTAIANALNE